VRRLSELGQRERAKRRALKKGEEAQDLRTRAEGEGETV
jgi:hypothetical protein